MHVYLNPLKAKIRLIRLHLTGTKKILKVELSQHLIPTFLMADLHVLQGNKHFLLIAADHHYLRSPPVPPLS